MSNPFKARFDSTCDSCGDPLFEDDSDVFANDGQFICESCANANDNICDCGNYKKDIYDTCYECKI